jgi:hypothetical protein
MCAFFSSYVAAQEANAPEEYSPDEFTEFEKDLRRAEIVFFGSLPFTFLFSTVGYDLGRYVGKGIQFGFDSNQAETYAPLFFAPAGKPEFTQEELLGLFVSSLVLSMVVTIIDQIIIDLENNS